MSDLLHNLGIDWHLLLSQAVNFLLLLILLRVFAYKPILKMLRDRKARIEEGVAKAKEAEARLHDANDMMKSKMKEADQKAVELMRETELKAKGIESQMLEAAREKEAAVVRNTELIIEGKAEEARREIRREAVALVKEVLVKTVELDPKAIDEAMIKKAVESVTGSK
jgi:F-type H+-transporting ATPase subunit b